MKKIKATVKGRKPSVRARIIDNNRTISVRLKKNEVLHLPLEGEQGASPEGEGRIQSPYSCVKPLEAYIKKYHLSELLIDESTINRAGYCLQMCDIYQYIADHFEMYDSVKMMIPMYLFICKAAIIEGMVKVSARQFGIGGRFQQILSNTEYQAAIGITSEFAERLKKLHRKRSDVHLALNSVNFQKKFECTQKDVDEAEEVFLALVAVLFEIAAANNLK